VVLGCAGERDKGKRPMMGKIAGRMADLVVLTAEDPRTESVDEIISQMANGFAGKKTHLLKFKEAGQGNLAGY